MGANLNIAASLTYESNTCLWLLRRMTTLQGPQKLTTLGSLHIQVKSRDHEIVTTQMKVSKGHFPKHLQNHVVRSHILKCSVKSYVTRPLTKRYFNEFLFRWVLTHDEID
jgi:hypothetical protein